MANNCTKTAMQTIDYPLNHENYAQGVRDAMLGKPFYAAGKSGYYTQGYAEANKMKTKARLIEVLGDQEEYADLIGAEGELYLPGPANANNWFLPKNRGDMLSLAVKRITPKDDTVRVYTKLGNRFTFRLIQKG